MAGGVDRGHKPAEPTVATDRARRHRPAKPREAASLQRLLRPGSSSGPIPYELILGLQRAAGNAATSSLLEGSISLQRSNGDSKPHPSLAPLANTLKGLAKYKKELSKFSRDLTFMEKVAIKYGFTLSPVDNRRAHAVPKDDWGLVEAGIELKNARQYIRVWVGEINPKELKKSLKKEQRKLLDLFLSAASNYERVYSKEAAAYLTKEKVGMEDIQPVYGAGEIEVLPEWTLVKHAVGPSGACIRELARPQLRGKAISKADVDELFRAYNAQKWEYMAAGTPAPEDLILGRSSGGVCGALAQAFLEMVKVVAKARGVDNPAYKKGRNDRFVTKRYDKGFIDPSVDGNIYAVRDGDDEVAGYARVARSSFQSHTWVEAFGTIYDPLAKQTGDFSEPKYGTWDKADGASTTGWMLEEVTDPAPGKGFSRGYRLKKASAAELLEDLTRRAQGLDVEKFKSRYR